MCVYVEGWGGSPHHEKAQTAMLVSRPNFAQEITKDMCGKGIRKEVPVECHWHWQCMKPMARNRLNAINFKKRILVWNLQKQIRHRNRPWENIVRSIGIDTYRGRTPARMHWQGLHVLAHSSDQYTQPVSKRPPRCAQLECGITARLGWRGLLQTGILKPPTSTESQLPPPFAHDPASIR